MNNMNESVKVKSDGIMGGEDLNKKKKLKKKINK